MGYHKLAYRTEFQGLPISVENRKGSNRHWYDPTADEEGTTKQRYPYGYIRGTLGTDSDEIDVYLGDNKSSDKVFIVTQNKAPDFKEVDEQKVMLGFNDAKAAKKAYLQHFDDDRFFGDMKEFTMEEFKQKIGKKKGKLIKSAIPLYLSKSIVNSNIIDKLNLYVSTGKVLS